MAPGGRPNKVGTGRGGPAGTHHQKFSRPSALYPSAGSTNRIRFAAIPGQFADSPGVERAWSADEPGREGRSLSETDRGDGASDLRAGCKAVPWLAPDALAVLPKPRRPREVAAAAAYGDNRAVGPRRREGNARRSHFVRHRAHRNA